LKGLQMKYFSLFSGIGGFELGIQNNWIHQSNKAEQERDYKYRLPPKRFSRDSKTEMWQSEPICIGFSEINKYATQIYKKHFPTHKEYGDVSNIQWSNVPDFEFLCGGFPCQSFSIAGKRGGFSDTRGTLFFEIARAAQEKQPRLLLLENVKGLLSHDKGRTFGTILNTLDELGYDLQWQVLNSKNFGVPQNRERVFIIGHLRTIPRPQVFPLRQSNSNPIPGNQETEKQLANTITGRYGTGNARGTHIRITKKGREKRNQEIASCLSGGAHSGGNHSDMDLLVKEMKIANAVTPDAYLARGERKRVNGKAVLTSMHERRIRRLSPTECERLQGFPDGWAEGISDTQRYKCLSNAVTVNVIEAIMEKLLTSSAEYVRI